MTQTTLEMFRYLGYINAGLSLHSPDRRYMASASVTPLFGGDIPMNVHLELAFNPMRDCEWFYLTVRYHYGFDEDQLDCGTPDVFLKHMIRFGISAQPSRIGHKLLF